MIAGCQALSNGDGDGDGDGDDEVDEVFTRFLKLEDKEGDEA